MKMASTSKETLLFQVITKLRIYKNLLRVGIQVCNKHSLETFGYP